MPSGPQYSPVATSPALPSNVLLAYIQNDLLAYAQALGITMPTGVQYQPVATSPAIPDNVCLAYIQNILCALVAAASGGGGTSGVQGLSVALASGQTDGYTATFNTAFASAPKVAFVGNKNSTADANFSATIYNVTTTGFSFDLTGDPGTGASALFLASIG